MGRFLALDYGTKKTGLAVSDPLKIIAQSLTTVPTISLIDFLKDYMKSEQVELFVLGLPKSLKNEDTHATNGAFELKKILENTFPDIPVHLEDERYTSKIAKESMILGGTNKKKRKVKENVDMLSATLILQSFMASNSRH